MQSSSSEMEPPLAPFALYAAGDAYSTAKKIMGRQSAGKSLLAGIGRRWPRERLAAVGLGGHKDLAKALREAGCRGQMIWSDTPNMAAAIAAGCLYYPAIPSRSAAQLRDAAGPASFSLMGVTHTLSSNSALAQLTDLVRPPFRPWDALICTSKAAHALVTNLHAEQRAYLEQSIGATRFNQPQLPIIPLGVNVPAFSRPEGARQVAREALSIAADEVVFLFAGRLTFHAKANPGPTYQALQAAAVSCGKNLVCIEAGVAPNAFVEQALRNAQQVLAPSVRFIRVDGGDEAAYKGAWQAADIFVSLSDNIQETFGLTPVEAMAAGLPVLVSDWDGYKDTVRDGIDGIRVPTVLPPAGAGRDLAQLHWSESETYDRFIGAASLATLVHPGLLADAMVALVADPTRRAAMGTAGRMRAQSVFDWPVILDRYAELAKELAALRAGQESVPALEEPAFADPFRRFAHFSTGTLRGSWRVRCRPDSRERLMIIASLAVANYAFKDPHWPATLPSRLLDRLLEEDGVTVSTLLEGAGMSNAGGVRALMWLWKFDIIDIALPTQAS